MSHGGPGGRAGPAPAQFPGLGESHACSGTSERPASGGGRVTAAPHPPLPRSHRAGRGRAGAPALRRPSPGPGAGSRRAARTAARRGGGGANRPPPTFAAFPSTSKRVGFARGGVLPSITRRRQPQRGLLGHLRGAAPTRALHAPSTASPVAGGARASRCPAALAGGRSGAATAPPSVAGRGGPVRPGRAAARGGAVARGGLRGRAGAERTDGRRRGSRVTGSGGLRGAAWCRGRRAQPSRAGR